MEDRVTFYNINVNRSCALSLLLLSRSTDLESVINRYYERIRIEERLNPVQRDNLYISDVRSFLRFVSGIFFKISMYFIVQLLRVSVISYYDYDKDLNVTI